MASKAYIFGVLDTLVKAGALSPDYAAGVMGVMEKHADADDAEAFSKALAAYNRRRGGNANLDMTTPQDHVNAINDARPWLSNRDGRIWAGAKHWVGDPVRWAWGKVTASPKTWQDYEDEYEAWRANDAATWAQKEIDPDVKMRDAGALASAYETYSDRINARDRNAKRYMTQAQRQAAGYGEKDRNNFQTANTRAAIAGGLYKLRHDYEAPSYEAAPKFYGSGLADAGYGQVAQFVGRKKIPY